jgi:Concanavalin A-like lectin/glucanases superfamily
MKYRFLPARCLRILAITLAVCAAGGSELRGQGPAGPAGCVPLPSGAVSWWPAEGDAQDILDGNHGTLQNGATFAPGKVGAAFSLDGVDDYVDAGNDGSLMPTSAITIEAWFKTGAASDTPAIVYKHGLPADRSYGLQIRDPSFKPDFFVVSGGTTRNHLGPTDVNDDAWHHTAGVFDGATLRHELYIDGAVVNNTPPTYNSIDVSTVAVWFGGGAGDSSTAPNTAFFDGLLDEITIYDRALSAAEIQGIFLADGAGKCPPPIPVELQSFTIGSLE